ncbi:MAG: hypothetical protein WCL51_11870 [Bacteroidota bacterium]
MTEAEEKREFEHLIAVVLKGKGNGIIRSNDFIPDIYTRLCHDPIDAAILPFTVKLAPHVQLLKAGMANRDTDLGIITQFVSKFEKKEKELPKLLDRLQAMTTLAFPDDEDVLKFFFLTDREKLSGGSEGERIVKYNGWLLRMGTKTPTSSAILAEATTWVNALELLSTTKLDDKGDVRFDRTGIDTILTNAYNAVFSIIGGLMELYPGNLTKILIYFNTNLLKPNETNPARVLKDNYQIQGADELIMNLPQVQSTPKKYIVFDNNTDKDITAFKSVNLATEVPDYGILIPKNTRVVKKGSGLGPDDALYFMIAFESLPVKGILKIAVRSTNIKPKKEKKKEV